jgi:hypothetical protein
VCVCVCDPFTNEEVSNRKGFRKEESHLTGSLPFFSIEELSKEDIFYG